MLRHRDKDNTEAPATFAFPGIAFARIGIGIGFEGMATAAPLLTGGIIVDPALPLLVDGATW